MRKQRIKLGILLLLVLILLGIAAFAPHLVPYDPYEQNLSQALQPPGGDHLLGHLDSKNYYYYNPAYPNGCRNR